MELTIGSIFTRPNLMEGPGYRTARHEHNFDHATFVRVGWILGRAEDSDGTERIFQIASPEFSWLRSLLLQHEPHKVPRPIRFPDTLDENGRKKFDIRFIRQGEDVPEGGEELVFSENLRWFENIKADSQHEFVCLSHRAVFDCTYSHRNPQGEVVQEYQEWAPNYE